MIFMNEYDIDDAFRLASDRPVLFAAVSALGALRDWTNANSDGWPYWTKPLRASAKLQTLIQSHLRVQHDIETAELSAALRPIKSFRTRQGADFTMPGE